VHIAGVIKTSQCVMQNTPPQKTTSSTAKGGPVDLSTSRPSLAGNPIKGAESRFTPSHLTECEFFRLPAPCGRCQLTNLSRTALAEAAEAAGALIRVRLPGKVRGSVLIDKARLLEHLRSLAVTGTEVSQ
jgi:hypothetical protein